MPSVQTSGTKPRTDATIGRAIKRKMRRHLEVPDERITIHVAEGVVTMEGTVTRESQRNAAEACASKVKGVRSIENKITMERVLSAAES